MPDGWESGGFQDITIPADAGIDEPRVFIGQDDPLLKFLGQNAGIVFYWADNRAYVFSVERSGGPDLGQLHIWSTDETHGIRQLIDVDHNAVSGDVRITLAQGAPDQQTSVDIHGTTVILDGETGGVLLKADAGVAVTVQNPLLCQDSVTLTDTLAVVGQTDVTDLHVSGELLIDNLPLPGTIVGAGSSGVSSGAIGAAETEVLLTDDPVTFLPNSAYEVTIDGGYTGSVVNADPAFRIRKSNGAATGQLACLMRRVPVTVAAREYGLSLTQKFTTTTPAPAAVELAVTMTAIAGTATYVGTFGGRSIEVKYLGPSTLYPNANVLT